jgi:hypothetical protein
MTPETTNHAASTGNTSADTNHAQTPKKEHTQRAERAASQRCEQTSSCERERDKERCQKNTVGNGQAETPPPDM